MIKRFDKILMFLLVSFHGFSQQYIPKDKVTLKDSSEYKGYIIEQDPGVEIKLYRIVELDTIVIRMKDIAKLNKIFDKRLLKVIVQ